jgi:hypothetical protein
MLPAPQVQLPPLHVVRSGQIVPHSPQSLLLVWVFTHPVAQQVEVGVLSHVTACPARPPLVGQQFPGWHVPLQKIWLPGQTHSPFWQTLPPAHGEAPPHVQWPPTHVSLVPLHGAPQAPQLLGSVCSSTHVPVQQVSPLPQLAPESPQLQTCDRHRSPSLGQIGGLSRLSEQQLPVTHCPWQQRLPLPAFAHDGWPSHSTHWPLPLQIGLVGSVHCPLLQHPLQVPLQQCWLPEQDSQIPLVGLQVSHCAASHALARQTLPQTRVFGQHKPLRQVSLALHVESHVPVWALQTLHCAGSHGGWQPPMHLPL